LTSTLGWLVVVCLRVGVADEAMHGSAEM
jgi:hypothetical protein